MRGYQPLFDLRMAGLKPAFLSIDVGTEPRWLCDHWHKLGLSAHILIEPKDRLETLDLRAVVKLLVHVSGHVDDAVRVRRVFDICVQAGADRVLGSLHRLVGGQLETVEHFDTAGVLEWLA